MHTSKATVDAFLARTRRDAEEIATRVDSMAGGLRRWAESDEEPEGPDAALAVVELRARNDELLLCIEELRSQRDALAEAHVLVERERAKLVELFELAPDAYVTTDPRGAILEANRAAGELLAVRASFLPGKLLIGFIARRETRSFRECLVTLEQSSDVLAFETTVRPRGGRPFRAATLVRAVRVLHGEIFAYRWAIRNASSPPSIV